MPPVGFEPTISAGEQPQAAHLLWCVIVCDLETSRIGASYIYDISTLRVKVLSLTLFGVTEENDRSGNGTVSLRSEYRKVFPVTCPESLEGSRDIAVRFL